MTTNWLLGILIEPKERLTDQPLITSSLGWLFQWGCCFAASTFTMKLCEDGSAAASICIPYVPQRSELSSNHHHLESANRYLFNPRAAMSKPVPTVGLHRRFGFSFCSGGHPTQLSCAEVVFEHCDPGGGSITDVPSIDEPTWYVYVHVQKKCY